MPFGQVVVGPPGSGKTTYCRGMKEFLTTLGRKVAIVNLDPANESLPYEPDVDINELINLEDVMSRLKLGPNGALMYCMEFLQKNVSWLSDHLAKMKDTYLLLDFPGQVELYTHHSSVSAILEELQRHEFQLVAVHLVDAHYCTDPGKFIAVVLTSLNTMLQLALPHVNVLSKIDLIEKMGKLAFGLEYYTEVMDLSYLLDHLNSDPFMRRFRDLNQKMIDLIENQSLVTFTTLDIQDMESVRSVLKLVDKAGGYVFGEGEARNIQLMQAAMTADVNYLQTANAREQHTASGQSAEPLSAADVEEVMEMG